MMSFLKKVLGDAVVSFSRYSRDTAFLAGATSAVALIIVADGTIDDSEQVKAIESLSKNKNLLTAFSPSQIEEKLTAAINNAKSRAGRAVLKRDLEALTGRPVDQRQDVFLIAAEVADDGGMGDDEKKVLIDIGKTLNVDGERLLAM